MMKILGMLGLFGMPGGVEWLAILLMGAVLVGIILLATGGRNARIVLAVLAGVFVLVILAVAGLSFLRFGRSHFVSTHSSRTLQVNPGSVIQSGEMIVGQEIDPAVLTHIPSDVLSPQVWPSPRPDDRLADVYPSINAAAVALTKELIRRPGPLDAVLPGNVTPESVRVCGISSEETKGAVADALRSRLGMQVPIEVRETSTAPAGTGENTLTVVVGAGGGHKPEGDTLRVTLMGPRDKQNAMTTRWVDKTWVERPTEYMNEHAGKTVFTTAHNATWTSSPEEAVDLALQEVAGRLVEPIIMAMGASHLTGRMREADPAWLGRQIAHRLQTQGCVKDRFVQSVQAAPSESRLYRATVLVAHSSSDLQMIGSQVHNVCWSAPKAPVSGERMKVISVVALIAFLGAVYLFLNAAAKGGRARWLGMAAVVLAVGGVLLLAAFLR